MTDVEYLVAIEVGYSTRSAGEVYTEMKLIHNTGKILTHIHTPFLRTTYPLNQYTGYQWYTNISSYTSGLVYKRFDFPKGCDKIVQTINQWGNFTLTNTSMSLRDGICGLKIYKNNVLLDSHDVRASLTSGSVRDQTFTVYKPGNIFSSLGLATHLATAWLSSNNKGYMFIVSVESTTEILDPFSGIVNGGWSEWSPWSECTNTCGEGQKTRYRLCNNPKPVNGGLACVGDAIETVYCINSTACPIDGGWSAWTDTNTCSVECGPGVKLASRSCTNPTPMFGGKPCVGSTATLSTTPCKVRDCTDAELTGWGPWSMWSACSAECGKGTTSRSRACIKPVSSTGQALCVGNSIETIDCYSKPCPVDGGWGSWIESGPCSNQCGPGQKPLIRVCDNPAPAFGGKSCEGISMSSVPCNNGECEPTINGGWSDWSPWGDCSADCGGGLKMRTRACNNPKPSGGGRWCDGVNTESSRCNDDVVCGGVKLPDTTYTGAPTPIPTPAPTPVPAPQPGSDGLPLPPTPSYTDPTPVYTNPNANPVPATPTPTTPVPEPPTTYTGAPLPPVPVPTAEPEAPINYKLYLLILLVCVVVFIAYTKRSSNVVNVVNNNNTA